MNNIPVRVGRQIAEKYQYDQVIIIARKIGHGEAVITYGVDQCNSGVAAKIGEFLKYKILGWLNEKVII